LRGTKLWQDTGSPLISGRSRREKPFWRDVLLGGTLALAGSALLGYLFAANTAQVSLYGIELDDRWTGALSALGLAAVPTFVGALAGAFLARKLGVVRPWVAATATGFVFGLAAWALLSAANLTL